jgi:hypothetical protein
MAASSVVDDQPSHHAGRIPHESGSVREGRTVAPGDVEIGLVQQSRDTQAGGGPGSRKLAFGQAVQLGVERGEQSFPGGTVASFGRRDER